MSIAPSGSVSLGDIWIQWGENDSPDATSTSVWSSTTISAGPGPTDYTASDGNQGPVTAGTNGRPATESVMVSTMSPSREPVEASSSMRPWFQSTPICGTATARGRMNDTYPWTGIDVSTTATGYCGFNSTGTGGICLPTPGNSTYQWALPNPTSATPYVSEGTIKEIRIGFAWLVTALTLTYHDGL